MFFHIYWLHFSLMISVCKCPSFLQQQNYAIEKTIILCSSHPNPHRPNVPKHSFSILQIFVFDDIFLQNLRLKFFCRSIKRDLFFKRRLINNIRMGYQLIIRYLSLQNCQKLFSGMTRLDIQARFSLKLLAKYVSYSFLSVIVCFSCFPLLKYYVSFLSAET